MRAFARVLLLILLVAPAVPAAGADEAVPIAFKFSQGDAINYDVSASGAGTMSVPGAEATSVGFQASCAVSQTVAQANEDGSAVLEMLVPRAEITVTIGGKQGRISYADGKVRWFTDGKEQTPPQVDLSKAPLLQLPIRLTTRPDGSVTEIGFANTEFLDMLSKAVPGLPSGVLGQSLPLANSTPVLPTAPVKVGEAWTRTEKVPLGPNQYLDCEIRRTLESVTKQGGLEIAKIVGSGGMRFRGDSKISAPGGQPLDISISDLRHTLGSTEFFNLTTGRLIRGDYEMRFSTKVSAAMAGAPQAGSVSLRILASVVGR
jgi:hypothetical protein